MKNCFRTSRHCAASLLATALLLIPLAHARTQNGIAVPSADLLFGSLRNAALGLPSDATPRDDFLLLRPQYILSYNAGRRAANWACWRLDARDMGVVTRFRGNFRPDELLPDSLYHVLHRDYTRSGFDRGHIVPSAERTASHDDNVSTFYTTNILPQHPDLNQGPWKALEEWCQAQCADSSVVLYIAAGGMFHDPVPRLSSGVAVPDSCFKIVVLLRGGDNVDAVSDSTTIVAVAMPNVQGIRGVQWTTWLTSVDRIEASTGYDFLQELPDSIEDALEQRIAAP